MLTNPTFMAVLAALSFAPVIDGALDAEPSKWNIVQRAPKQTRERPVNVLTIDKEGALHWNGASVTEAHVREFVSVTKLMKTRNIMVLEARAQAPSAVVERLRSMIEDILACQPTYCSEVVPKQKSP